VSGIELMVFFLSLASDDDTSLDHTFRTQGRPQRFTCGGGGGGVGGTGGGGGGARGYIIVLNKGEQVQSHDRLINW
jgi:hypothetical protein